MALIHYGQVNVKGAMYDASYDPATGRASLSRNGTTYDVGPQDIPQAWRDQQDSAFRATQSQATTAAAAPTPDYTTVIGRDPRGYDVEMRRDNASGSLYTVDPSGNRILVSEDQRKAYGVPSVAGYDQQGNAYYATDPTDGKTPEQRAYDELRKTDPNSAALRDQIAQGQTDLLKTGQSLYSNDSLQQQIAQARALDPTTASIRDSLGNSINSLPLDEAGVRAALQARDPSAYQAASNLSNQAQQLTGSHVFNNLGEAAAELKGNDPTTQALRQQLSKYYSDAMADPYHLTTGEATQVEQETRAAQAARGNINGDAQAAVEAMNYGKLASDRAQQRATNSQSYLSSGQDWGTYLSNYYGQRNNQELGKIQVGQGIMQSGQTLGDKIRTQQGQNQQSAAGWLTSGQDWNTQARNQASQNYNQQANALGNATNDLNSGQTVESTSSRYLNDLTNRANAAAGSGSTPSSSDLGSRFVYMNPSSGQQFAQGSNQWYNSIGQFAPSGGPSTGQSLAAAGTGALSGAAAGAMAGSVIPGVGTVVGGLAGALIGGAGGYLTSK